MEVQSKRKTGRGPWLCLCLPRQLEGSWLLSYVSSYEWRGLASRELSPDYPVTLVPKRRQALA